MKNIMDPAEDPDVAEFIKEGVAYFKQMRLENEAHMLSGMQKKVETANERLAALEKAVIAADHSSSKLARALNYLTFALVVVTALILAWDIAKWAKANLASEAASSAFHGPHLEQ